jgi:hypothetical protein
MANSPKPAQRDTGPSGGGGNGRSAQQRLDQPADSKDVLSEAKRRADEAWAAEYNNVTEARDCQRFYAGGKAQWDEKAWTSRTSKGRPVVTINRLPQFVRQVTGEIRKNPPGIKVSPSKGKASQATADTYSGIIRHIESQSRATAIYVKAAENQVQTGQGYFRIVTEYSSNDAFEQDIRFKAIKDPLGALVDPFAQRLDGLDKRYAFVFDHMSIHDFQEEYPGKALMDVAVEGWATQAFPWRVGDTVRIAEYWRRVPAKKTIYLLDDGGTVEANTDKPNNGVPADRQVVNMREVNDWKVEMYRISGGDVLSGPHAWAGRYIPVFMVSGEEITMDGNTVRKGMVHDARDPQRILNYSRSASVEAVALQPKAPFIGTVDQFKGRPEWKSAGSENHAYLAYNPDPKVQSPPQRAQPAIASDGLDKQTLLSSEDLKNVTGIQDASLGIQSNETSGIAIANRQREGDTATYFFVDNLRMAIGAAGEALVDLIPRIYDTPRQVAILKEDGQAEMVTVNGPPPMRDDGQPIHPVYKLSDGEYAVSVSTGPSFATQRAEMAANMIEAFRGNPKLYDIAGDLLFKNMDFPGAAELAKRIGKTIAPPLKDDSVEEMPPMPPPPDVVAKAEKDAAEAGKTKAETQTTEVETATMLVQLQATLAQIQQMLAGGAPMGGPPGPGPGGPMPSAPPPAPDMMPPMDMPPPELNGAGDGLPPMIEVETMPDGVAPV